MEFFPKQANADYGSLVRGPLGIHHKPGAGNMRGWFDGCERQVGAQLSLLANQPVNSATALTRFADELRGREPIKTRPPRFVSEGTFYGRGRSFQNILELIPVSQRTLKGKNWITQCPACAAQGTDSHRDNLHIAVDGAKFWCVEGGPGKTHRKNDIRAALTRKDK